jgi:hypothetical protein
VSSEAVVARYMRTAWRALYTGFLRSMAVYFVMRKMLAAKALDRSGVIIQARNT